MRYRPQPLLANFGNRDRWDAWLWCAGFLLLSLVPVGAVSGDGVGYAQSIDSGQLHWNPNHLLFQPLGLLWAQATSAIGVDRPTIDRLILLSIWSAALAVLLFRGVVAPRLAISRRAANVATAWFACNAGFAALAVTDEFHLVRMPALLLLSWATLRYLASPGVWRAAGIGAIGGICALQFISDGLIAVAIALGLAVWHRGQGATTTGAAPLALPRMARMVAPLTALVVGLLATAGSGLWLGWRAASPGASMVSWLTAYSGVAGDSRLDLVYGARFTPAGWAATTLRTGYGAANTLMDLTPAVAAVRDRGEFAASIPRFGALCVALACVAGALRACWRRRVDPLAARILLLAALWSAPTLVFALYWNDSNIQFFLPLALAAALLWLRLDPFEPMPGPQNLETRAYGALLVCSVAVWTWNVADVARRLVLYPRVEHSALLRDEVRGAGLVVLPGFDPASILLALPVPESTEPAEPAEPAVDRLTLASVAVSFPTDQGWALIERTIDATLARGERVVMIDVDPGPPREAPWKFLGQLGFDRPAWTAFQHRYPELSAVRERSGFAIQTLDP